MELPATVYLYALGAISTTFVGFSAIIMIFRQTAGGGLSPMDSWITLVFIQLGFLVTAGSLSESLLQLCDMPSGLVWRLCSGIVGAATAVFAASYPLRRRTVTAAPTPVFVWIDLLLLTSCTLILLGNAVGRPLPPNAGSFSVGLTGILFIAGAGYLHALGDIHRQTERVVKDVQDSGRSIR
jgi:hypothetical protein